MSAQRRSLPFTCPECQGECATFKDYLTCHPRTLRAFTDQLIKRDHDEDRYMNRVVGNRISNVLRQEVRARLARQTEGHHDRNL